MEIDERMLLLIFLWRRGQMRAEWSGPRESSWRMQEVVEASIGEVVQD